PAATQAAALDDRTLVSLFEARCANAPQGAAVEHDGTTLSYAELDARANRLAWRIIRAGLGPEDVVAIMLERSADLVVAVLGVLKSGAAYMPLDPDSPRERLALMLAD